MIRGRRCLEPPAAPGPHGASHTPQRNGGRRSEACISDTASKTVLELIFAHAEVEEVGQIGASSAPRCVGQLGLGHFTSHETRSMVKSAGLVHLERDLGHRGLQVLFNIGHRRKLCVPVLSGRAFKSCGVLILFDQLGLVIRSHLRSSTCLA